MKPAVTPLSAERFSGEASELARSSGVAAAASTCREPLSKSGAPIGETYCAPALAYDASGDGAASAVRSLCASAIP